MKLLTPIEANNADRVIQASKINPNFVPVPWEGDTKDMLVAVRHNARQVAEISLLDLLERIRPNVNAHKTANLENLKDRSESLSKMCALALESGRLNLYEFCRTYSAFDDLLRSTIHPQFLKAAQDVGMAVQPLTLLDLGRDELREMLKREGWMKFEERFPQLRSSGRKRLIPCSCKIAAAWCAVAAIDHMVNAHPDMPERHWDKWLKSILAAKQPRTNTRRVSIRFTVKKTARAKTTQPA